MLVILSTVYLFMRTKRRGIQKPWCIFDTIHREMLCHREYYPFSRYCKLDRKKEPEDKWGISAEEDEICPICLERLIRPGRTAVRLVLPGTVTPIPIGGYMFVGWHDANPSKPIPTKVEEGISAYVDRFRTRPNVVIISEDDMPPKQARDSFEETHRIVFRSEGYIRRNNFWIGYER